MLKHVLVMMLLAPRALVWGASDEATWGNGLEVDNTTPLAVLIENVSEEEEKIGLTSERIEARVNQSLRKGGITPASERRSGAIPIAPAHSAQEFPHRQSRQGARAKAGRRCAVCFLG